MTAIWTDERSQELAKLWEDERLTASMIAKRMGGFDHCKDGGRSAVLGRVHRMNLSARVSPIAGRSPSLAQLPSRPPRRSNKYVAPNSVTISSGTGIGFIRKKESRQRSKQTLAMGYGRTSAEYRISLGLAPEMSVNQRRAFLEEAMRNTAALQVSEAS